MLLFHNRDDLQDLPASSKDPLYSDLSALDNKVHAGRTIRQSSRTLPLTNQICQNPLPVQISSCHPLTPTIPTSSLCIPTPTLGFPKTLTTLQTTHINFPTNSHLSSNRVVALPLRQLQPMEEVQERQLQPQEEAPLRLQPQFPTEGTATTTTSTTSVQDPTVTGFRFQRNL